MDIEQRIKRRERRRGQRRLIENADLLSPIHHVGDPVGRGPLVERLLDLLDPVFSGHLPPNGYVCGPGGVGKSAVVSEVFRHLDRCLQQSRDAIGTSTRAQTPVLPAFSYIDGRWNRSQFAFYHTVLNRLVDETVPEHGISTDEIRRRLHDALSGAHTGLVLAVDHVTEMERSGCELDTLFRGFPANVSWLAVGRADPSETPLTQYTSRSIRVEPYLRETLIDLLMARASEGLASQALPYERAELVAEWADGDAHDALAVLFAAAIEADRAGRGRIEADDVEAAIDEMPDGSVSLGKVFALPPNWQSVLRELVDLDPSDLLSVTASTEALAPSSRFDLSQGTIKRVLYELADAGIVARIRNDRGNAKGRPSSRLEPRFPTDVFRWLYDQQARTTVTVSGHA